MGLIICSECRREEGKSSSRDTAEASPLASFELEAAIPADIRTYGFEFKESTSETQEDISGKRIRYRSEICGDR